MHSAHDGRARRFNRRPGPARLCCSSLRGLTVPNEIWPRNLTALEREHPEELHRCGTLELDLLLQAIHLVLADEDQAPPSLERLKRVTLRAADIDLRRRSGSRDLRPAPVVAECPDLVFGLVLTRKYP